MIERVAREVEPLKQYVSTIRAAIFLAVGILSTPAMAAARAPIERDATPRYDAAHRVFRLDAGGVTYAMGVNADGMLQTVYWGARLPADDPLGPAAPAPERSSFDPAGSLSPQEYAGWGGAMTATPALKIRLDDGNRDLVLRYDSYKIDNGGLAIVLRDAQAGVAVTL